jgi:hypothetical protein
MGHATVSLRELRDGEKQLTLESRGNPKEEVKGAILISGSTGSSDGMRGSFLGRSAGRVLMDSTISADTVGMLSVHKAAYAGDVEWLNKLLSEKKASSVVQAKCRMSGWVALEYAVHGDHVEAAKAILAVSTESCENVLHLVRSEEMAALLLAAGFRPSSANRLGQTSLVSVAQRGGSLAVLRLLLEKTEESDVMLPDACGRTALFFAVRAGRVDLVQALLQKSGKWQWTPTLEKTLAELMALKPSLAADVSAALRKAALIK